MCSCARLDQASRAGIKVREGKKSQLQQALMPEDQISAEILIVNKVTIFPLSVQLDSGANCCRPPASDWKRRSRRQLRVSFVIPWLRWS